jgi:predicted transcriptional regulator
MLPKKQVSIDNDNELMDVARALSSPQRLDIVKLLQGASLNIKEIATALKQPMSSTALNVEILREAGIIDVETRYTQTGKSKLCSRSCDGVIVDLFRPKDVKSNQIALSVPIGAYVSYKVTPSCGMVTGSHTIGQDNDEDNFFNPEHFNAQLLWFGVGYVEYRVSRKNLPKRLKGLEISFEACSEAPFYRNDWKSDITLWINDAEVGTWRCPGDFGGRPGALNPAWWPQNLTQYGMLCVWTVTEKGAFLNHNRIGDATPADVKLDNCPHISFKIGVKADAYYKGGINLFGSGFGDYKQDITVKASW